MQNIINAIKNKCCVVFAGAGISRSAGLPSWAELAQQLYDRLNAQGKIAPAYQSAISTLLTNRQLAATIDMITFAGKRQDITKELREILEPNKHSDVHDLLKKIKLCGFITTNYDRLIDSILPINAYHITNSIASLKLVPTAISGNNQFLIKLHGDLDDELPSDDINVAQGAPFLVLSKQDYTALIQGERGMLLRTALFAVLQKANVLFLGYNFGDPDIIQSMDYLSRSFKFPNASWFVTLKSEQRIDLPDNVTILQPIQNWSELPLWLTEIYTSINQTTIPVEHVGGYTLGESDKQALKAISEYIHGLETDNIAEKVIASVVSHKQMVLFQTLENPFYPPFFKGRHSPPLWKRGARGDFIKPVNCETLH